MLQPTIPIMCSHWIREHLSTTRLRLLRLRMTGTMPPSPARSSLTIWHRPYGTTRRTRPITGESCLRFWLRHSPDTLPLSGISGRRTTGKSARKTSQRFIRKCASALKIWEKAPVSGATSTRCRQGWTVGRFTVSSGSMNRRP